MTAELFQTIYIFSSLAVILLLSAIWKTKKECTCRVKVPASGVALITSLVIGGLMGFSPLAITVSSFLLLMTVGSILYPRVDYAGPAVYLVAFVGLFAAFEIFKINDVFNIGLENVSIFGALIAIIIMFMKKQDNVITIYIVGMSLFFITATTSGFLPLVISSVLVTLSEVILIYLKERENEASEDELFDVSYFSAGLYSFGVMLLPLILL